jgi:hypothetical protein
MPFFTANQLRDGPWHTGMSHLKPQTCVDQVEVEVAH